MIRLLIVIALLLVGARAWAATPTWVNGLSGPNFGGSGGCCPAINLPLPQASLAGNLLIASIQWAVTDGVTLDQANVTDDQSQTGYTCVQRPGSGGFQSAAICYRPNTAAGVTKITIPFSGGSPQYVGGRVDQFYNVDQNFLDVTSCTGEATSAATSWAADNGSSCTLAGNASTATPYLVYHVAFDNQQYPASQTSIAAASGYTLLDAQGLGGNGGVMGAPPQVTQYQVVTTSVTNPTILVSPGDSYVSVAIAVKSATAGTPAAAGIRVQNVQHNYDGGIGTTVTIQAPTSGNLIVLCAPVTPQGGQWRYRGLERARKYVDSVAG